MVQQGRGDRTRSRVASADCLIIQSAAQRQSVRAGDRVTVGRMADIAIAQSDSTMHEVVCTVIAGQDWTIEVPTGNVVWVDVMRPDGAGRLVSIPPGRRWSSSEASVEVRVRTRAAAYRFTMEHVHSRVASRIPSSTRRTSDGMIQLQRANDRALVVACADRLQVHTAPLMEDDEVAARLGCTVDTAKQRINRALRDLAFAMELAGEVVPASGHDRQLRAAAIDWLVCTGTVTADLVRRAIDEENRDKGRPR